MDLLTPISREQMRMYTDMPQHIRTLLQRCINDVFQAMIGGKSSCLIEHAIRSLQVKVHHGACVTYDPKPVFGVQEFIALLQFKFPGCNIEYLQDHWHEVDATTRRKVSGILISWS